ncbi:hypothetical protein GCM10010266_53200 [Streptomyces griseomycini]|uniref:hypothetical protein n=1 Tax=Streptomyces griseomycini TaxID=66895 RepID=UPI001875F977|nr:hypothetical protein [Streptomyces griseomycini]GGQ23311.1 hypothetical protein GCM10010266_53200 [Streptomyces griseomycini]
MNGYEHYQRAEELAAKAEGSYDPAAVTALANVHATLALASAITDANRFREELYAGNGEEPPARTERKRRASAKSRDAANDYL